MTTFYPVCVTLALFIALILFDILDQAPERIRKHTLEGLIILALMTYLSIKDMELVSWGLLLIPVVILITCYILGRTVPESTKPSPIGITAPIATASPASCTPLTISTPESLSTASKIISNNNMCNATA